MRFRGRRTIATRASMALARAPSRASRARARPRPRGRRRRAPARAATRDEGERATRKIIAVFPSDGDSRARDGARALAHATTMASCVNARVGRAYEAVVVRAGEDGAWADCAVATTRDARAGRARAAVRASSDDLDDDDDDEERGVEV